MLYYGLELHSLDTYMQFKEVPVPGTPQLNEIRQYAFDASGVSTMCWKNDAGAVICLPTTGGTLTAGGVTGTGVAGRVAFWDSPTSITSDADFTFAVDQLTVPKISAGNLTWDGSLLHINGGNNEELFRLTGVNQILSIKEVTGDSAAYFTFGTDDQTNAWFIVPESAIFSIDAANDSTTRSFVVKHDTATSAGGQDLFTVTEVNPSDGDTVMSVLRRAGGTDALQRVLWKDFSALVAGDKVLILAG